VLPGLPVPAAGGGEPLRRRGPRGCWRPPLVGLRRPRGGRDADALLRALLPPRARGLHGLLEGAPRDPPPAARGGDRSLRAAPGPLARERGPPVRGGPARRALR